MNTDHTDHQGKMLSTRFSVRSIIISNKLLSFAYASIQLGDGSSQQILQEKPILSQGDVSSPDWSYLLESSECSEPQVLLHPVRSEHDWSCEVFGLSDVGLDVGALHHALLTVHALDEAVSEPGGGVGHGEGGAAGSVLRLDHLRPGVLDPLSQSLQGVGLELHGGRALTDQGQDRHSGVTSDHGTVHLGGVEALQVPDESVGPDNVKGRHAEDLLGIEAASLLVNLASNGDSGVDRVGDDGNHCIGTNLQSEHGQSVSEE